MWEKIEVDLFYLAADKYNEDLPELKLFAWVMVEAGKLKDTDYFESGTFRGDAFLMRLKPAFIYSMIQRTWDFQSTGELWAPTPPLVDEN